MSVLRDMVVCAGSLLLAVCLAVPLCAQEVPVPVSPRLDMVTVDPATGFAHLSWLPSPSPAIAGYVVYTFSGGVATAIDTIHGTGTLQYTHTASAARYRSVAYVVAAIDSSANISPLSNSLSTIWLSAEYDPCAGTITVSWTPYDNARHPALSYRLLIGGEATPATVTLPVTAAQYVLTGYEPDTEYCLTLTANDDGTPLSSSNRVCVTTGSEAPPQWTAIHAVTAGSHGITLLVSYDPSTTMERFAVYRYQPGADEWRVAASATGTTGTATVTVSGADTTVIHLFRAAALNSCGLPAAWSGTMRNMVPELSSDATRIHLRWNSPDQAGGWSFTVWRDHGSGWHEVGQTVSDTVWSEEYAHFANEITAPAVAYRVRARRSGGNGGEHTSSAVLLPVMENLIVPNAFTPSGSDINAIFRPALSFMPAEYELRIYGRNGALLFRTDDPAGGWDGRDRGRLMPPGVYLWTLRMTTPSGQMVKRSGTVTILP